MLTVLFLGDVVGKLKPSVAFFTDLKEKKVLDFVIVKGKTHKAVDF